MIIYLISIYLVGFLTAFTYSDRLEEWDSQEKSEQNRYMFAAIIESLMWPLWVSVTLFMLAYLCFAWIYVLAFLRPYKYITGKK